MTLSTLKRLRAIPAIALALLLAAALAGCSSPEPAEEPVAAAPAEEPATQEPPAAEEPEEPATEFDTQQREPISQDALIASIDSYVEGFEGSSTQTCEYDDAGRLVGLAFDDGGESTQWTYDEAGNLLTETKEFDFGEETYTSTVAYKYNEENLPVERTYETTQPPMYFNPETGEEVDDPSQGELAEWDVPRITYEWSERGAQETLVEYHETGEETTYEITYQTPIVVPLNYVSIDPFSNGGIGYVNDDLHALTRKALDADGFLMRETNFQYNNAGQVVSASMKNGDFTTSETYTYDEHGNETSSVIDAGSDGTYTTTYEWQYDGAGNPIEKITRDADMGDTYEFFTYDAKGRLKTQVIASPFDDGYSITCGVFNYVIDNEELATTPEQLMTDARAQVETA